MKIVVPLREKGGREEGGMEGGKGEIGGVQESFWLLLLCALRLATTGTKGAGLVGNWYCEVVTERNEK